MEKISVFILVLFLLIAIPTFLFIFYALYKECENQHLYIIKKENSNQINYNTI